MTTSRTTPASSDFWVSSTIDRRFDIARLRSKTLPRGRRFETVSDANRYRDQRVEQLGAADAADDLRHCSVSRPCLSPACPLCARGFRRWFTAELLKIHATMAGSRRFLTVFLAETGSADLHTVDVKALKIAFQQRLRRAAPGAAFVGGIEAGWDGGSKTWVIHAHGLAFKAGRAARESLNKSVGRLTSRHRVLVAQQVKNPVAQLSYALKFTTLANRGPIGFGRDRLPLNAREVRVWADFVSRFEFLDFVVLHGARRRRTGIELTTRLLD